jgi:hypothetical protein
MCFAHFLTTCSLFGNQISDNAKYVAESYARRNVVFADMKCRVLAFRLLALHCCEYHVAAELWDVISFDFVLSLCLP